jgi:tRNA-Thr(GGU) m(6)t(6)A37 methyltransferase TsaA
MACTDIVFRSIGTIHSAHKELDKIPIQPVFANGIKGKVVLKPEFIDGILNLQAFSHIYLFYYFHMSQKTRLHVKPYLSDEEQGIFATRAPHRPNKLGMSLVRLASIEGDTLYIEDIDIVDGTPLIDIKPYIKRFDLRRSVRSGWHDEISEDTVSARGRRNYDRGP